MIDDGLRILWSLTLGRCYWTMVDGGVVNNIVFDGSLSLVSSINTMNTVQWTAFSERAIVLETLDIRNVCFFSKFSENANS